MFVLFGDNAPEEITDYCGVGQVQPAQHFMSLPGALGEEHGNNLSSSYISDLLDIIGDRDFSVNVISKSGTTGLLSSSISSRAPSISAWMSMPAAAMGSRGAAVSSR